jgi:hypothetical protein
MIDRHSLTLCYASVSMPLLKIKASLKSHSIPSVYQIAKFSSLGPQITCITLMLAVTCNSFCRVRLLRLPIPFNDRQTLNGKHLVNPESAIHDVT